MTEGRPAGDDDPPFRAEFYDLETSKLFCASSAAMADDPQSKTGRELRCLQHVLADAPWSELGTEAPVNLVDLGAGSGTKARVIATALVAASSSSISFHPVDASTYCANYAVVAVLASFAAVEQRDGVRAQLVPADGGHPGIDASELDPADLAPRMLSSPPGDRMITGGPVVAAARGYHADFVRELHQVVEAIRSGATFVTGRTLFALLGQTIGNLEDVERQALLDALFDVMVEGDQLVLDFGVRPEDGGAEQLEARQRNLEAAYEREAFAFMQRKADTAGSVFHVAYDADSQRIDHWFARPDGSVQMLGFSRMFSPLVFMDQIEAVGFRVVSHVCSLDLSGLDPGPECAVMLLEKSATRER